MSIRSRAEARLVLACADVEDQLAGAKSEYADELSDETRAAKREAMATMHETRAWLRAKDELAILPDKIADVQRELKSARLAKAGTADKRIGELEAALAFLEARHKRIQAQFGPLVQAMDELAAAGGA
ncbi:hypothetical protein [Nonomuraea lactucae]|uniref:hypothetical protein n=1 Tax=Nonomuraea lactucae TaxID=2249762 RepID=UPI000DE54DF7|nr:hypothetical protein [Nonomuraea lactucae]